MDLREALSVGLPAVVWLSSLVVIGRRLMTSDRPPNVPVPSTRLEISLMVDLTVGQSKVVTLTPHRGDGPGAMPGPGLPLWTVTNPAVLSLVVEGGSLRAGVTALQPGSSTLTVAAGLLLATVDFSVTLPPADRLDLAVSDPTPANP